MGIADSVGVCYWVSRCWVGNGVGVGVGVGKGVGVGVGAGVALGVGVGELPKIGTGLCPRGCRSAAWEVRQHLS